MNLPPPRGAGAEPSDGGSERPDGEPVRIDARGARARDVALTPLLTHLREGGLVVHPTETVYGFGSLARGKGLDRLLDLKGRDEYRPVLLLVPDAESVEGLTWTDDARRLAETFWPGSVTLVLADPDALFPPGVRSAEGTVAVRRTAHPLTARLVTALGEPMTSTSANGPGGAPAREGREALAVCRDLEPTAKTKAWLLDVGALPPSATSTIVDCTRDPPRVRRAGATPVRRLRCLLPEIDDRDAV